jgi:hypothetical protein
MKLWSSFLKELKLASRGFYFYVEITMALILLVVLLLVIPENFNQIEEEYMYLDLPQAVEESFLAIIMEDDLDGVIEDVTLEIDKDMVPARLMLTDEKRYYVLENKKDLIRLVDDEGEVGGEVYLGTQGELRYTYYLQGYESERLRNILLVFHNEDINTTQVVFDAQDVRAMNTGLQVLSDRENALPVFLTFNGSLMGLFIVAAYVFLDKKEGVVKAFAVTPSPVWQYLLSKIMVISVTSIVTSLVLVIPVMGLEAQYGGLLIFLLTTGFFTSSLGLLVTSYYENITQSFGALYVLMMGLMVPGFAYYIPSWEPAWIRWIPTYYFMEGFKETILPAGDLSYVLLVSVGFLMAGIVIFLLADWRYKNTLSV